MERLLTQQEAAELLNVDVRFLRKRIKDKNEKYRIKAIKISRKEYRFRVHDLEDYLKRNEVEVKIKRGTGRPKNKTQIEIANELAVIELQKMGFDVGG